MAAPLRTLLTLALALLAGCSGAGSKADATLDEDGFQWLFEIDAGDWNSTGRNDWFVLEPGYQLSFENERKTEQLVITVLDKTRMIDNVETRVVEERETAYGKLKEVSRNYFAFAKSSNDAYYFGEDVDLYKDGVVVSHEGSWLAGVELARYGMMLPAKPRIEQRWFQEQAEDVALDRCEVSALDKSFEAPAGKFTRCLEIVETSLIDLTVKEKKLYAPGVGLVKDGSLRLITYGKVTPSK